MMVTIFERGGGNKSRALLFSDSYYNEHPGRKKIDKGRFTIVSLVSDELSKVETAAWHASDPKKYKIRVTDPKAAGMSAKIHVAI